MNKIETLGLVGGNMLSNMISIEAKKRCIKTILLEPELNNIAGETCDSHITAPITEDTVKRLALKTDAIVFCTGQLVSLPESLMKEHLIYPSENGLQLMNNRIHQLTAAELCEVPVPKYYHQNNKLTFFKQMEEIELPFRLYQIYEKHYDVLDVYTKEDLEKFLFELDDEAIEWLIEEINDYDRFLSVTALKAGDKVCTYPVQEEVLNDEAVKYIYMPAEISKAMHTKLTRYAKKILKDSETEGLFTFKFGVKSNRQVELININPGISVGDIATNHYSDLSVYEQLLNLIQGLPIKDGEVIKPSVTMVMKEENTKSIPKFPYHHYHLDRYNKLPVGLYLKEYIKEDRA